MRVLLLALEPAIAGNACERELTNRDSFVDGASHGLEDHSAVALVLLG